MVQSKRFFVKRQNNVPRNIPFLLISRQNVDNLRRYFLSAPKPHSHTLYSGLAQYGQCSVLAGFGKPVENRPQHALCHYRQRQKHLRERHHIADDTD